MKHQKQIVVMTGFFLDDERWNHDSRFIYLHHPGAGKELIKACEAEAKRLGKEGIRLDYQKENTRINEFYQSLGYMRKGTLTCSEYHGIKREQLCQVTQIGNISHQLSGAFFMPVCINIRFLHTTDMKNHPSCCGQCLRGNVSACDWILNNLIDFLI